LKTALSLLRNPGDFLVATVQLIEADDIARQNWNPATCIQIIFD
jgi:hypothetical protein